MQSTKKTGPQGNDTARSPTNPDPKGKGKETERPKANPDPKGKGKEKMPSNWADDMEEAGPSRRNETATERPERPGLGASGHNPFNPKGFKGSASRQNDRQVGKKRPAEMTADDPRLLKAAKWQQPDTTIVGMDRYNMPSFVHTADKSIWQGTNVATEYAAGVVSQIDPKTKEGRDLQQHVMNTMAEESPLGQVIMYTAPAFKRSRGDVLKEMIEGPKGGDNSKVGKYHVKLKSPAAAQTNSGPSSRHPAPSPYHKVTFEQRSSSCAVCESDKHGTGDCPGGYEMRHGDVPICPNCHSTSANNMHGHTFDTVSEPQGKRDWGCRHIRAAFNDYKSNIESRAFLIKHLLVNRQGKAPIRAEREENCFISFALYISRQHCGNQMPEDIGSVWPLTKADAVEQADALRNWDNLAPEDRPQSSLNLLDISEIRRLYEAGELPPQVFDLHEDIQGDLSRRDRPAKNADKNKMDVDTSAGTDEQEAGPPKEPTTFDDSLNEIIQKRQTTLSAEDDGTASTNRSGGNSPVVEVTEEINYSSSDDVEALADRLKKTGSGELDEDDEDDDEFMKVLEENQQKEGDGGDEAMETG